MSSMCNYYDVRFDRKPSTAAQIAAWRLLRWTVLISLFSTVMGWCFYADHQTILTEGSCALGLIRTFWFAAFAASAVTGITWFFLFAVSDGEEPIDRFAQLPKHRCAALLDLCRQHADLEQYRQQVVAMGRSFTNGEFVAMNDWPDDKARREAAVARTRAANSACRELYGIEEGR